jgi:ferric-dicitrate binding protein FerR (iron transport regulator)
MKRFLAAGFKIGSDAEAQEAMRRHLQECEECAEIYRTGVETTVALGGALRSARRREARLTERGRPRLGGLGAMGVLMSWSNKEPSNAAVRVIWRLRPILLVAFFFWLILWVTKPGGPGPAFRVDWQAGLVVLDGKQLIDDGPNFGLVRGQMIETGSEGVARVRREGTQVELGPRTRVLCERIEPARLRLVEGRVVVEGPLELTSDRGTLVLEGGGATVWRDGEVLWIECHAGSVRINTALLEVGLGPGEGLGLDAFGQRIEPQAGPDANLPGS